MEDALGEGGTVLHENLQTAAGPAHALYPGLGELDGLLIVDDGLLTVCYLLTVDDVMDRELNVLRQEVEGVAVHLLCDPAVEHESGAGYAAACVQEVTGTVEILSFS